MRVVYTIHAIRDVGLTPFQLGIKFAAGGVGLLVVSLMARASFVSESYYTMIGALAINALGLARFPISNAECYGGITWLIVGQFISDIGRILF
mmetsp:Transcript_158/g.514  ORF Transcript_158/g.514 Transcript_158/m.514 type:complete len:93 (+) Transcript_158:2503-2781(+)